MSHKIMGEMTLKRPEIPPGGPKPWMDKEVHLFLADEGICVGSSGELDHIIYK